MSHPYDSEADSRCSLQLPRDQTSVAGLQLRTGRAHQRVLVVEDEPSIRGLVGLHLSLANFAVEETGDGAEALDIARGDKFDLILLDVMLPGLDGLTLCRAIRTQGANVATPIMMLSARDTEADKVLGLESGADDYLTKP